MTFSTLARQILASYKTRPKGHKLLLFLSINLRKLPNMLNFSAIFNQPSPKWLMTKNSSLKFFFILTLALFSVEGAFAQTLVSSYPFDDSDVTAISSSDGGWSNCQESSGTCGNNDVTGVANSTDSDQLCTVGGAGTDLIGDFFLVLDMDGTACGNFDGDDFTIAMPAIPGTDNGDVEFRMDARMGSVSTNSYTFTIAINKDDGNGFVPVETFTNGVGATHTLSNSNKTALSYSLGDNLNGKIILIRLTWSGATSGGEGMAVDEFALWHSNPCTPPSTSLTLGTNTACDTDAAFALTGGTAPTGAQTASWSGTGVTGSTFDPSVAGVGTHTITYSLDDAGCTGTATEDITVVVAPTASILSSSADLCDIHTRTLVGKPSGGTFMVTSGPATISGYTLTATGAGTVNISYTYDNGACAVTTTQTITTLTGCPTPIDVNPCNGTTLQDAVNEVVTNNIINQTILVDLTYFTNAAPGGDWGLTTLAGSPSLNGLVLDFQDAYIEAEAAGLGFLDISGIDDIIIKNLILDGFNRSNGAINVNTCEGVVFENVKFVNSPSTSPMNITSEDGNTSILFTRCLFSGNPVSSAAPSVGTNTGAISLSGDASNTLNIVFENTKFRCNGRQGPGGAVQIFGDPGAVDRTLTTADFLDCEFANNTSSGTTTGGGAMHINNKSTVNISGTTFYNNSVSGSSSNASGGAINVTGKVNLNLEDCYFIDNSASGSSQDGGAIGTQGSSSNKSDITMTGCVFTGNSCTDEGGAIFFRHSQTASVENCLFVDNTGGSATFHIENAGAYTIDGITITGASTNFGNPGGGTGTISNSIITGASTLGALVQTNCTIGSAVTFTDPMTGGDTNPADNNYDVVGSQGTTIGVMVDVTSNTSCPSEVIGLPISLSPPVDPCDPILDIDQDSDGITDVAEIYNGDDDGDGTPDYLDPDFCLAYFDGINGWDCTDGLPDPDSDLDGDGVPNYQDPKFPGCGGIVNGVCSNFDNDGDGNANHLDLDADNDGIPDVIEAGGVDVNGDGFLDDLTDTDKDGLADLYDTDNAGSDISNPDTDGDGIPDFLDLDADNDGIADVVEAGGTDANSDGLADDYVDLDNDGFNDVIDQDLDNSFLTNNTPDDDNANNALLITGTDTDADGIPNSYPTDDTDQDGILNHLDLDADNDGIPDVVETGGTDTDGDGIADNYTDTDNNGWNDVVSNATNTQLSTGADANGDGVPDSYPTDDTDGDDILDYLDLDADNDGIPDVVEAGGTDEDGDGIADNYVDMDKDGFNDIVDGDVGNDGTAENTANAQLITGADTNADGAPNSYPTGDLDGDQILNYLDLDSDDDGIVDVMESGGTDANGDGMVDGTDSDNDGFRDTVDGDVGNDGTAENTANALVVTGTDANLDGVPDDYPAANQDGFGNPNFLDIDADDDGITDNVEGQSTAGFNPPTGMDDDGDGIDNAYDNDSVRFGGSGIDASTTVGTPATPNNFDGLADNPDYLDLDSDEDGISDLIEGHDYSYDGSSPACGAPADADNDGLLDCFDTAAMDTDVTVVGTNSGNCPLVGVGTCTGSATTELPENTTTTDNDNQPDFRDILTALLPVELIQFAVSADNCDALLSWSTASEENSAYFIIEKSELGRDFIEVDRIFAAGNSLDVIEYNYLDAKSNPNTIYRLKIVDLDGTFDYSKNVIFFDENCGDKIQITNIYPNPVNEELHINLTSLGQQPVVINVFDVTGKNIIEINTDIIKGSNDIVLDTDSLLAGIYFLHIIDQSGSSITQTIRFVKH